MNARRLPAPPNTDLWRIWLITIPLVLGLVVMGWSAFNLSERLIESVALDGTNRYALALQEFRTLYTSEVVERALTKGIDVTHDYKDREGAIPLPATLSMMLGNRMTSAEGGRVRLYSDYPFPWRAETAEPLDEFDEGALRALRKQPDQPYYRFQRTDGQLVLRYAIADQMRPSCVGCHNTHPDSPKTDWKVGDVRGVLEVIRPIEPVALEARRALKGMLGLLIGTAVIALGILVVFLVRLRRSVMYSQQLAGEMLEANTSLTREMEQRLAAEKEQVSLRAQVLHVQKLESIGLLAGGIAHDFNNLLSIILGNTEVAIQKLGPRSVASKNLEHVREGVDRAADLTSQLLAYAGKTEQARVATDLNEVIEEMSRLIGAVTPTRVAVAFDLEEGLPPIEADPGQLQQVLLNLITNASEAIGDTRGRIRITTSLETLQAPELLENVGTDDRGDAPFIVIEVVDSGVGMSPEVQDRMFDPFFSTKGTGRGLGLSALQGIVRSMGGFVLVESKPGEGTSVQVTLPCSEEEIDAGAIAAPDAIPPGRGQLILAVDDEQDVLDVVRDLLNLAGYSVLTATSGTKALELFDEHKDEIILVVLDLRMPGMSGTEVLEELRKRSPGLPIILCSGYKADLEIDSLVRDAATSFLSKPFRFNALETLLQRVIGSRAAAP